jgi:hypothetical protein
MVEGLLAIQLRMGTNGLDAFFFQARFLLCLHPSTAVAEDNKRQNTSLSSAPWHAAARQELRDEQEHLCKFSKLLGTGEGLRKTTRWVMQREILGQFRGARDVLYGPLLSLSPAQD